MERTRTSLPQLFSELAEGQRVLAEALEIPEHQLLSTETLVMALLESRGTRTPTDLAGLTGLSRGRITHLVTALIKRGYVTKQPDHVDRRRFKVSLTADGKAAGAAAAVRVNQLESSLIQKLGAAGVDMLAQQLSVLRVLQSRE